MIADVPLRVPRHRVDPAARWLWALQGLFPTLLLAVGWLISFLAVPDSAEPAHTLLLVLGWLLPLIAAVAIVVQPLWRYRVHRWEVTDQAVHTLVGWLDRTWRIVPIARIQTVDTTRGPVQQLFGLSTVIIRTASHAGSTEVEQLDAAMADAVAHDLALRANAVRDEVT